MSIAMFGLSRILLKSPEPSAKKDVSNEETCAEFQAVESLATCTICYMKFNDGSKLAKSLHCGHTFCAKCIESVSEYGSSRNIECPSCRKETDANINQLPPNYQLMDILRRMHLLDASDERRSTVEEESSGDEDSGDTKVVLDEAYRTLITRVKTVVSNRLDDYKDTLDKDADASLAIIRVNFDNLADEIDDVVDNFEFQDFGNDDNPSVSSSDEFSDNSNSDETDEEADTLNDSN